MGSLEPGLALKRDHLLLRSSSLLRSNNVFLGQRTRSRFARWVLFKRIDSLHFICGAVVFFFFVFIFQIFILPGHVIEIGNASDKTLDLFSGKRFGELSFLKDLDFGEDFKFEPLKIVDKFHKMGLVKAKLALIFADLWVDEHQILIATVASALLEIGYDIEVFSPENGPPRAIWGKHQVPISIITADENLKFKIDWLNYDGILVNSLQAMSFLCYLMQDPFKNVPLVWTVHEQMLATQLRQYVTTGQTELINIWRKVFSRASVVVFPNYILPMSYSACDPGNYFVIPGSLKEAFILEKQRYLMKDNLRLKMGYKPDDFVVAVVGSQLGYKGLWLEHTFVLQALHPLLTDFSDSSSHLRITVLAGASTSNYSRTYRLLPRNWDIKMIP